MPEAYAPATSPPMLVPTMKSMGMWCSSNHSSTPTCAMPRALPPPSASPMRGRGCALAPASGCAAAAAAMVNERTASRHSLALGMTSLVSQGDDWIDATRAARRQPYGDQRDERQNHGHGDEYCRIGRLHTIQERGQELRQEERGAQADGNANDRQQHPLQHDHVLDLCRRCAKGDADADLLRSLLPLIPHQPVA